MSRMLGKGVKTLFFPKFSPAAGMPPAKSSASGNRRRLLAITREKQGFETSKARDWLILPDFALILP